MLIINYIRKKVIECTLTNRKKRPFLGIYLRLSRHLLILPMNVLAFTNVKIFKNLLSKIATDRMLRNRFQLPSRILKMHIYLKKQLN